MAPLPQISFCDTQAGKALYEHCTTTGSLKMKDLFTENPKRFEQFSIRLGEILFDYSKNRITAETMQLLLEMAEECQLEAAKALPLSKLLLETDAPFLTPTPFRGKICQPKHVRVTAEFLAGIREESLEELAAATTKGAKELFKLV